MAASFKSLLHRVVRRAANMSRTVLGHSLLLMLFYVGCLSSAQGAIPASEREVLTNLYNSTNGAAWSRNTNWMSGEGTECTWAGVACDDTQSHIIRVELNNNHLVGTLPSLSGLTALRGFSVTSNHELTGSVPSLAGLTDLQYFIVSNNQLSGPIPSFSGLPALHNLQLNNNRLTGSIPSLRELPALDFFSVSSNQLTGPIPPLDGLTALQSFVVALNGLTGSIPALDTLTALQVADFSFNQLTGPIPVLSRLKALKVLLVHYNQLGGPIPSLSDLTALLSFRADGNQLSGPIPTFDGLTALHSFGASENQLTALPNFNGATKLVDFSADNNRMAGSIPSLSGLTALQSFSVNSNRLTGQIPSLAGLTSLRSFSAENNQLTGSIPSLSGAPFFTMLGAGNNQLTGPVPAAPGTLQAFVSNLCGNRLVSSGSAATDSAWVKAQSPVVVPDGNWLACQNPVFHMTVSGRTTPPTANVIADVFFRPQDVGSTASLYVFALAPVSLVRNVPLAALSNHIGPVTRSGNPADIIEPCVLAQLVGGELTYATSGSLQATSSGVLGSIGATVSVLDRVSNAIVTGAVFYVGYGPDSTSMMNNGIHRRAVTVFGNKTCQVQAPQTGWWWNPAEDGRGFSIEVRGNNLFMSGYLYDESGHATWLVSPGPVALDGSLFKGALYQVTNGQTLTGTYKAPSPPTSPGSVTLSFTDARNGTLTWAGGTVPIVRFDDIIGSGNGATPSFVPENGWWWNESESGRGFFIEFKNNFVFMAGYMYEADGRPVWYVAQNPMTTPQTFSSTWLQVAGGQTLTGAYKKPVIVNSNVGPVSIQFQDATNAVMTLPGGKQLTIYRHRF